MQQLKIILSLCLLFSHSVFADQLTINSFQKGSYQTILEANKNQAFVLVIWSVTCGSCLAEMAVIQQAQQQHPQLKFVMLSVDGPEYYPQMQKIIKQKKLSKFEHWGFAEDNSTALRYAIDKRWYGEIPRTYFFDNQHKKEGFSGVMDIEQYNQQINQISKI